MDDPGGGGGFDVGDDVVAVVIHDESGQHIPDSGDDIDGQVLLLEEEEEADDDTTASWSNVIVDDSPLQNQMERNKECKSYDVARNYLDALLMLFFTVEKWTAVRTVRWGVNIETEPIFSFMNFCTTSPSIGEGEGDCHRGRGALLVGRVSRINLLLPRTLDGDREGVT